MASPVAPAVLMPGAGRDDAVLVGLPARLAGLLTAVLSLSLAALLAILAATGMALGTDLARFVLLAAAMVALAGYCRWRSLPWRLSDSAVVVAFVTGSLLLCGLVSCTGLRLGLPLADGLLARGDGLVGFDVRKVVAFTASQPAIAVLLHFVYNASGPLCIAAVAWRLVAGDRAGMWRIVATIGIAMHLTGLVSILFPARGAISAFGLQSLQGQGLPVGAGTYFAKEFARFYAGSDPIVSLKDMNGIVCFPSFHTVMALVIVQGFAATRLKWLAVPWGALTIVSTVPMGGHYVVDLAGGSLVWLSAYLLAGWAGAGRSADRAARATGSAAERGEARRAPSWPDLLQPKPLSHVGLLNQPQERSHVEPRRQGHRSRRNFGNGDRGRDPDGRGAGQPDRREPAMVPRHRDSRRAERFRD